MGIKKTSREWELEFECVIIDPDGWDRRNYEYSFFEELITREEFLKRIQISTVKFSDKLKKRLIEVVNNGFYFLGY